MIEVQNTGLQVVGALNEVAQDAAIFGDTGGYIESGVKVKGGGYGVRSGADAADTLGQVNGISGVPALQQDLKAAEHNTLALGVLDLASFNSDFNLKVTFKA
jgi:hypothetical protein